MLVPPATFPYQGSYALTVDTDLPPSQQGHELVRILYRREGAVVVSFPLRLGASGTKSIPENALIDPTPLDQAERKELAELFGHLLGRERLTKKMKLQKARHDALRNRTLAAEIAKRLIARAEQLSERKRIAA